MASNRTINTKLFKDRWVRSLSPLDKLLFVYLLTNISTNIAGAYEIEMSDIELDTGLTSTEIDNALERFQDAGKAFYRDGWMYVTNFIKHQSYESPKIQEGIIRIINNTPNWIKNRVSAEYNTLSHLILLDSIQSNSIQCPQADENQEAMGEEKSEEEERPASLKTNSSIPKKSMSAATPASAELDVWLDAIANSVGAKSRHTMSNAKGWSDVCIKAMKDGRDIKEMLDAVTSEKERNANSLQFFSPNGVLKVLQLTQAKPKEKQPTYRTLDQINADAAAARVLPPKQEIVQ